MTTIDHFSDLISRMDNSGYSPEMPDSLLTVMKSKSYAEMIDAENKITSDTYGYSGFSFSRSGLNPLTRLSPVLFLSGHDDNLVYGRYNLGTVQRLTPNSICTLFRRLNRDILKIAQERYELHQLLTSYHSSAERQTERLYEACFNVVAAVRGPNYLTRLGRLAQIRSVLDSDIWWRHQYSLSVLSVILRDVSAELKQ